MGRSSTPVVRILLATLALAVFAAQPGSAQDPRFEGTFRLVPDASEDIGEAIEEATDHMNFIVKRIARGRLKGTNDAYRWLTIDYLPGEIAIGFEGRDPVITPSTGRTVEWERDDGELFDVSTSWRGGALEQTFRAEDGTRTNLFRVQGDQLHMDVTITSPKLEAPLSYRLVFERG